LTDCARLLTQAGGQDAIAIRQAKRNRQHPVWIALADMNLGDFSANNRVIFLSIIAIGIGVLSAFVALALLRLIGLFTGLTSRQQARNVDFACCSDFLSS
jgi:hypothetical protein